MRRYAVIILAAGGSSRLGRPKQLVPFRGATLVAHAAQTALDSGANPVIVVIGAHADEVRAALAGLSLTIVENSDWPTGMGGSIRRGIQALGLEIDACILMLCDQPAVTVDHLQALAKEREENGRPFVVTAFEDSIGPPAVFARSMFEALKQIPGDQGARAILQHAPNIFSLPFAGAATDVDTEEDIEHLTAKPGPT